MELKCTNSNGEIVLEKEINHIEFFFGIAFIKESSM